MQDLYYFNLGFRSENSRRALEQYSQNQTFSFYLIRDAEQLISDCLNFYDPLSTPFFYDKKHPDLASFVMDIFPDQTISEVSASLLQIQSILHTIRSKKQIDVKPALHFFSELTEKCLAQQKPVF